MTEAYRLDRAAFSAVAGPTRRVNETLWPFPTRGRTASVFGVLLVSAIVGCEKPAEISRYQVPSEPPQLARDAEPVPGPTAPSEAVSEPIAQRMLGAIIPVGQQVWFFKTMGPVEQISPLRDAFGQLLDSVEFASEDAPPTWTVPEGWSEQPGNAFRYATLIANGVEITVSKLGLPGGQDLQGYLLSNVNRWREQLNLPPVNADQFAATTVARKVADRDAILVDLAGTASAGGPSMGRGPMSGSVTAPARPPAGDGSLPAAAGSRGAPTATVPDYWTAGATSSFRIATYNIQRDGLSAEVTAIPLGPASGSVLDNVNRWRGEIGLEPSTESEVNQRLQPITVAGVSAQLVELLDAPDEPGAQATLAVIAPLEGQTLFLKLRGDRKLVEAERDNFRVFAETFQMPGR